LERPGPPRVAASPRSRAPASPRLRALLLLAAIPLAACRSFPTPTPNVPPPPPTVVVSSGLGRLATSTALPPTPTALPTATEPPPTATLTAVVVPEESTPALLRSPTPELRPSRTVVPSPTALPPLETPVPPDRPPRVPTATRAPARSPVPTIGVLQRPVNTPAPPPPHFDFAHAQTLASGTDVAGAVLAPGQSNVHRFDVAGGEGQVTVTISGPDVELYRATVLSPDGAQAGPGLPVGTSGRAIRVPIRGQTGTWYVEVAVARGATAPRSAYTIRVDVRAT